MFFYNLGFCCSNVQQWIHIVQLYIDYIRLRAILRVLMEGYGSFCIGSFLSEFETVAMASLGCMSVDIKGYQ